MGSTATGENGATEVVLPAGITGDKRCAGTDDSGAAPPAESVGVHAQTWIVDPNGNGDLASASGMLLGLLLFAAPQARTTLLSRRSYFSQHRRAAAWPNRRAYAQHRRPVPRSITTPHSYPRSVLQSKVVLAETAGHTPHRSAAGGR